MASVTDFLDTLRSAKGKRPKQKIVGKKRKETVKEPKTESKGKAVEEESTDGTESWEKNKKTVFIRDFPYVKKAKKVKRFFTQFGPVRAIWHREIPGCAGAPTFKIIQALNAKQVKTCTLFVEFCSECSARRALEAKGAVFQEKVLQISRIDSDKRKITNAIFIGNLAFTTTEQEVRQHFESCGPIREARVMLSAQKSSCNGCGYVSFYNRDAVSLALRLNGSSLCKRQIRVLKYMK